jgi:hypothetical protein
MSIKIMAPIDIESILGLVKTSGYVAPTLTPKACMAILTLGIKSESQEDKKHIRLCTLQQASPEDPRIERTFIEYRFIDATCQRIIEMAASYIKDVIATERWRLLDSESRESTCNLKLITEKSDGISFELDFYLNPLSCKRFTFWADEGRTLWVLRKYKDNDWFDTIHWRESRGGKMPLFLNSEDQKIIKHNIRYGVSRSLYPFPEKSTSNILKRLVALQTTDQKWQGVLHTMFSFGSHQKNEVGSFPASIRFRFTKHSGLEAVSKEVAQTTKEKLTIPTVRLRRKTRVGASPAPTPTPPESAATKRKLETNPTEKFTDYKKEKRTRYEEIAARALSRYQNDPDNLIAKEALQRAKADLLHTNDWEEYKKVLYGLG